MTSRLDARAPARCGRRVGHARDQLGIDRPIFSGFGQFSLDILSLRKQADAPRLSTADRHSASSSASGASARAVTTSTRPVVSRQKSSIRPRVDNRPAAPVLAAASRRNAAFLWLLSTRWTCAPGRSGERAGDHQARKARAGAEIDPDRCASGASAAEAGAQSATCRVQSCGSVDGATRFIVCCHLQQQRRRSDRAAPHVSRETGVSPAVRRARARSAAIIGLLRRPSAAVRRAGHAPTSSVSAAGVMPSMRPAWPMRARAGSRSSFCAHLVREPGDAGVVEVVRQREALVAPDRPRCRPPGGRDRPRIWRRSRAARR